jgi:hypothetical protein
VGEGVGAQAPALLLTTIIMWSAHMPTYKVTWRETTTYTAEVEAESEEAIYLNDDDYFDHGAEINHYCDIIEIKPIKVTP